LAAGEEDREQAIAGKVGERSERIVACDPPAKRPLWTRAQATRQAGNGLKGILPPPRQRHHSSSAIEPQRFASLIPDPMEKRSIAHAGRRCDAAASQRIKGISS
jgi:hypothetical protein